MRRLGFILSLVPALALGQGFQPGSGSSGAVTISSGGVAGRVAIFNDSTSIIGYAGFTSDASGNLIAASLTLGGAHSSTSETLSGSGGLVLSNSAPLINATGAGTLTINSAAAQGITIDSAGAGTAVVAIGGTNATTVQLGRSGQALTAMTHIVPNGGNTFNLGSNSNAYQGIWVNILKDQPGNQRLQFDISTASSLYKGNSAASGAAHKFGNVTTLTSGDIAEFFTDTNFTTVVGSVTYLGGYQGPSVDTIGATTLSLGTVNATTATVGRSGQTTNINGNAAFGTAGPNLGGTVTGAWSVNDNGALAVASTNYGAFSIASSATNVKFREVTCTHSVAGTSTAGTLAIRNVTDSSTLCSGSYTCTTTANTPTLIFDCNATPLASKAYAIQFSTGCGGTQVTGLNCNVEIAH